MVYLTLILLVTIHKNWKNIRTCPGMKYNSTSFSFNFQKKLKSYEPFYTLSSTKCNEMINFVLSLKLKEQIDFPQTPLKANIFYANRLLYVLQKK